MYEDIHVAEDILNQASSSDEELDLHAVLQVLDRMTSNLRRQRSSHLGNESL